MQKAKWIDPVTGDVWTFDLFGPPVNGLTVATQPDPLDDMIFVDGYGYFHLPDEKASGTKEPEAEAKPEPKPVDYSAITRSVSGG